MKHKELKPQKINMPSNEDQDFRKKKKGYLQGLVLYTVIS